ncbi:GTP-binding protein EhRabX36 [Entamoeba marina]
MSVNPRFNIKIPILGDFGVGKTSILYTFTEQDYEVAPIDIKRDYISYEYEYQGQIYQVDFWDTNGSEQYGRVTNKISECDGGVFVCSYDSPESIRSIPKYLNLIKYTEIIKGNCVTREAPFIIMCSKYDLVESGENDFSPEEFEETAAEYCPLATFQDIEYCNWDSMYIALSRIMDEAIETHNKWYAERTL